jgi:GNAT superfamily N-acetyltransferase
MAEIKQLWVDEDHRGCGLGRGLLEAAIAEAIDRRFQAVWALSYEFQAPGLYAGRRVEGLPARPQPHRALLSAHWPMTALVVKEHNDA